MRELPLPTIVGISVFFVLAALLFSTLPSEDEVSRHLGEKSGENMSAITTR